MADWPASSHAGRSPAASMQPPRTRVLLAIPRVAAMLARQAAFGSSFASLAEPTVKATYTIKVTQSGGHSFLSAFEATSMEAAMKEASRRWGTASGLDKLEIVDDEQE